MCLVFIILMEKGVPTCTASSECGHVMYDDVREGTEKGSTNTLTYWYMHMYGCSTQPCKEMFLMGPCETAVT